jgi:hypothetical protein
LLQELLLDGGEAAVPRLLERDGDGAGITFVAQAAEETQVGVGHRESWLPRSNRTVTNQVGCFGLV